jgi:signal transduction histidine kinase
MESRRTKTIAGMFLRYVCVFCLSAVVLLGVVILLFSAAVEWGLCVPANYAEQYLNENEDIIRNAPEITEDMIPFGSAYGVYEESGKWKYGNLDNTVREEAWEKYGKNTIYSDDGAYYRFIKRENQEVCIVRYNLIARYRSEWANRVLPPPEILGILMYIILFLIQAFLLAGRFSRKMKEQLSELEKVTAKIEAQNLEFEEAHSNIREIDETLAALNRMKDALKESLQKQWQMEADRTEQLGGLAHDIKTPLTVIRGNVELLAEEDLSKDAAECAAYIRENVAEIDRYLEKMREVLYDDSGRYRRSDDKFTSGTDSPAEKFQEHVKQEQISCGKMTEILAAYAARLAAERHIPINVQAGDFTDNRNASENPGQICCVQDEILRAWGNIVGNALEYTNREKGILVSFSFEVQENREQTAENSRKQPEEQPGEKQGKPESFLVAKVTDFGPGFTQKDLRYALQEFYRGDQSRHDRSHQGLGLAIAERFARAQGGKLILGNSEQTKGAETALWLKISKEF